MSADFRLSIEFYDAIHFIRRAGWKDQSKNILSVIDDEKQSDEIRIALHKALTEPLWLSISYFLLEHETILS